ncbi:MAG TPA: aminoglycoside phosphotransferase family protein [Mobilitalea sp.]|nr:aminoglycoside phosphotransferase family protein [Mobilitalea sp.]
MKGKLIGEGNTAEVYSWGENEILKLFRQKFPYEGIDREYNVSKAVESFSLPVPKVGQMIDLDGRRGIIYEKISGSSMLELIMKHPGSITGYSKQMANLHYQVHQCKAYELPKYKEALEWNIRHTDLLTDNQRFAVLDILEKLPEGRSLCHGDFHPGNIIETSEQSVILDWMTATSGEPAADVARTMMLLKDGTLPDKMPAFIKLVITLVRRRMANTYLKQYLQLSGLSKEDILNWRVPIMAARLTEWVSDSEKNYLVNEINKVINGKK